MSTLPHFVSSLVETVQERVEMDPSEDGFKRPAYSHFNDGPCLLHRLVHSEQVNASFQRPDIFSFLGVRAEPTPKPSFLV